MLRVAYWPRQRLTRLLSHDADKRVLPETNSKGAGAGDEATAGVDEGGEGVIRLFSPIIWMLGSGQWASPLSAISRQWEFSSKPADQPGPFSIAAIRKSRPLGYIAK